MKFPTIVLALSGVASAQFPFGGGFGGGPGGIGDGWGFAPSCAVRIAVILASSTSKLMRNLAIMLLLRLLHMECFLRTLYQHSFHR
jgi:hypothetical protein